MFQTLRRLLNWNRDPGTGSRGSTASLPSVENYGLSLGRRLVAECADLVSPVGTDDAYLDWDATIPPSVRMKESELPRRRTALGRRRVADHVMGRDEENPLRQLLEADLDVALHAAIKDGDPAVVQDLLRSGADPDAVVTAKDGDSQVVAGALHAAVDEGNPEIVRILLDAGAEPSVSSDGVKGKCNITGTALHIAVSRQHLGIVQLLLKVGADTEVLEVMIEGPTEIRRTALFASATEGWLEGVRALLEAGADPDAVSADIDRQREVLWSALHAAAAKGHAGVVRALLGAGAAHDALTNEGETALQLARSRDHDSCVAVLEEAARGEMSH